MITVERVDGADGLAAVEAEWWDLWRADPYATPFQSPAWLTPWAAVFQPDRAFALLARSGGRLLALLPLFALAEGGPPRLLPLGAGTTDWLGGLALPDAGEGAMARLLAAVEAVPGWSALDLPQLPPDSVLARLPAPWPERREDGEPCPVVTPLPPVLSKGFAQNLRTARNRLDRAGPWRIRRATGAGVPEVFNRLVDLHGARWRARGESGVLADDRVRAFHSRALLDLEASGMLRMTVLELVDRPLAVIYGLAAKGRFHCYITGFDPEAAVFSPGAVLIDRAMRDAAAEGLTAFDFLRGRETYKYAWGAVDRPSVTRQFKRGRA